VQEGGLASAKFDIAKCSFTITIKNTIAPDVSGKVNLTMNIGSAFSQIEHVDLY